MRNLNFLFSNSVQGESDLTRYCPRDAFEMPLTCPRHLFHKMLILSMLLMSVGVGSAWGDVLTITSSNVQTGSYPTSEATFILSGTYTFGYMQMYNPNQNNTPAGWKAGQTIQSRKDASNYGRMYNKTSITGLSKIRLWILSGNDITTYTGSSMMSSTPSSGGISLPSAAGSESVTYETATKSGKTWSYGTNTISISYYDIEVPSGHTYFYVKNNNSSTTQIYKIELFYSTCTPLGTINGSISLSNGKRTDSPKQNQTQDNSYVWQKIG